MPGPPPAASTPAPAPRPRPGPGLALRLRQVHGALAPLVLLPLLVTVLSGLGYRLLKDWGGLGRTQVHWLMTLHEGEWLKPWLGPSGETLYVLLNGLGVLWMVATGLGMLVQRWRSAATRATQRRTLG